MVLSMGLCSVLPLNVEAAFEAMRTNEDFFKKETTGARSRG